MKHIDREAASQHVKAPRALWHALIFYTVGEIVKRERGKEKDPDYKPYADRAGVYAPGRVADAARGFATRLATVSQWTGWLRRRAS